MCSSDLVEQTEKLSGAREEGVKAQCGTAPADLRKQEQNDKVTVTTLRTQEQNDKVAAEQSSKGAVR